jgi:hypothetical protein
MMSIVHLFAAAGLLMCLAACSSSAGRLTETPYRGPDVAIETSGENHVLVVTAPSAGYRLTIDRVSEAYRSYEVFATLREPDGRFMYTQALVELRSIIPVSSSTPIRVGLRVLGHEAEAEGDYPIAATAGTLPETPRR